MIDVGSAVGYLLLDASGFESGFDKAMKSMKTFQDESSTVGDKFAAMGSAMTSVGSSLTKSVTLPLVGIGTAAVKMTSDFDSSMAKVEAISGATGDELDALREKAKEMGAQTKFTASESADAFTYMAMAGWKTEDMLNGIEGIMNLAAASGEDLALTSDIVTDALTAFGLQAQDSAHFADVLAAASNSANTNVSMLGESFKYVAPAAGSLGYSVEDTSVALGLMANSGIKASQAGTALRTLLTNMVNPTDNMNWAMRRLNVSLTDNEGNMKSLNEVMVDLRKGFRQLSQAEQAEVAANLAGKEGMSGLLAIVNASETDFNKLTKAINAADGTAQDMADTMLDNLGGQLTILGSALEGLAISFGEVLVPTLTEGVRHLTQFVDNLNAMDDDTKQAILTFGMIVAAIGPMLLIFGKLASSISAIIGLIGGTGGLAAIIGLLAGPLGVVIGLVATLTAAWVTDFGNIREYTSEIFTSIGEIISAALDLITMLWDNNFLGIQTIVENAWNAIETIFDSALRIISDLFVTFAAVFSGDWEEAWENLKDIGATIWEAIKKFFSEFLNGLVNALVTITAQLWGAGKSLFQGLLNVFKEIWNNIKSWFSQASKDPVNILKNLIPSMLQAGKDIFTALWNGLKSVWSNITSWVTDAVNWIKDKVSLWNTESSKMSSGRGGGFSGNRQGSYASGLDYVPRDMDVRVHEGESIWTKQETNELIEALKNKGTSGDITVVSPIYLDGKKITQVVTKRQLQEARANG